MQEKLQAAKHAFETKQHHRAKEIIVEIIQTNQYESNYKLYNKLGDIQPESIDENLAEGPVININLRSAIQDILNENDYPALSL